MSADRCACGAMQQHLLRATPAGAIAQTFHRTPGEPGFLGDGDAARLTRARCCIVPLGDVLTVASDAACWR